MATQAGTETLSNQIIRPEGGGQPFTAPGLVGYGVLLPDAMPESPLITASNDELLEHVIPANREADSRHTERRQTTNRRELTAGVGAVALRDEEDRRERTHGRRLSGRRASDEPWDIPALVR
jgi:hypothetical protein